MQRIDFELKPSRIYRSLLGVIAASSIVVIFTLQLDLLIRLGLSAVLLLYFAWIFWRDALLLDNKAVTVLSKLSAEHWVLQQPDSAVSVSLQGQSIVTRWISVLYFAGESESLRPIVVFPDALVNHDYRALIRALRLD